MATSKLIYYLDDDNDDLMFFQNAATNLGHKIVLFSNGQELLGSLRLEKKLPNSIFLDVHMPILNGVEMLNVLKNSEWGDLPVVMVSAAYPKKLAKQFTESGADFLMKKRSSIGDLELAIEEALQAVN